MCKITNPAVACFSLLTRNCLSIHVHGLTTMQCFFVLIFSLEPRKIKPDNTLAISVSIDSLFL